MLSETFSEMMQCFMMTTITL